MGLFRFLLACIVVLSHTTSILSYSAIPSELAVQSFYVISGFYMSLILNEKYLAGQNKLFYKNRALKIYPVYWIILVLLVGWGFLVNKLGYPGTIWFYQNASPFSISSWTFFLVTNVIIIGLDLSFCLGIKNGNLYPTRDYMLSKPNVYLFGFNSIAWTVGVELLFYLMAPFVLRKRLTPILILLFSSLFLRVYLAANGLNGHPWDYMFFPTQFMFFMGGGLSYRIYLWVKELQVNQRWLWAQYALLVASMLFYSYFFSNNYYKQAFYFIVIILFVPASFIVTSRIKLDRYLGNLSYPIYISQMLVINVTRAKSFPKLFGAGFTTLILVIILSMILERWISRPIDRIRQTPFNRKRVVSAT